MDPIVLEHDYPYTPDQVWEALTDPALMADWLMPGDFKAVVGHRVTFHCDPQPGFDGTVEVEVLEADKPVRLAYSWKTTGMTRPTTVRYLLTRTATGTRLRLEHTGFDGEVGRVMRSLLGNGWKHKLDALLGPAIGRGAAR